MGASAIQFDIFSAAFLVAAVHLLYHHIVFLWWTMDDAFHLHILTQHPHSAFLGPAVWRNFGPKLYTPLLLISLELDRHFGGYTPRLFYQHQMTSVALACGAFFVLIRLWCRPTIAFGSALLLIAGTPFCSIVQQLMMRHYIEGLICATAAATCFILTLRRHSRWTEALSAVAYFLAAIAKEIYVPLPLILLLLPEGDPSLRLRRLRFHGGVLMIYLALRWWNLGTLTGGYGWATEAAEVPRVAIDFFAALLHQLLGSPMTASLLGIAGVTSLAVIAIRCRRAFSPLLAAFVVALAPILPVAKAHEARYGLGLWILFVVIVTVAAILLEGERRSRIAIALMAVAIAGALLANRIVWRASYASAQRMSAEARWFVDAGSSDVLRNPAIPPAAMAEFSWLKAILGKPPGTRWFYDDIYLCSHPVTGRVFEYRTEPRGLVEVSEAIRQSEAAFCRATTTEAPLSAKFAYSRGVLHWQLGPYRSGQYRFLLGDGVQAFDVPPEDGFQLPGGGIALRVLHVDEASRRVYSPTLVLDFVRRPVATWQR